VRARSTVAVTTALVAVLVGAGCSSGGDDGTLAPLSIPGARAVSTTAAPASTAPPGPTTPGGLPQPTEASTPGSASAARMPTGDWDGARYDVGTIERVGTQGVYTTIELDRWSYREGDGPPVDASGLTSEPVVGWWREVPFTNQNVRLRTFVLAPDVEILTLDPAARFRSCRASADGAPSASELAWREAGTRALDAATEEGTFAVITYNDTGQIRRLRLTRGC
jgi:hypothetical protein